MTANECRKGLKTIAGFISKRPIEWREEAFVDDYNNANCQPQFSTTK